MKKQVEKVLKEFWGYIVAAIGLVVAMLALPFFPWFYVLAEFVCWVLVFGSLVLLFLVKKLFQVLDKSIQQERKNLLAESWGSEGNKILKGIRKQQKALKKAICGALIKVIAGSLLVAGILLIFDVERKNKAFAAVATFWNNLTHMEGDERRTDNQSETVPEAVIVTQGSSIELEETIAVEATIESGIEKELQGQYARDDYHKWDFFIQTPDEVSEFLQKQDYRGKVLYWEQEDPAAAFWKQLSSAVEQNCPASGDPSACDNQGRNTANLYQEEAQMKTLSKEARGQSTVEEWRKMVPEIYRLESLIESQQEIADKYQSGMWNYSIANSYQRYADEYIKRKKSCTDNVVYACAASIYYTMEALPYLEDLGDSAEIVSQETALRYLYARYKELSDYGQLDAESQNTVSAIRQHLANYYLNRYGRKISEQKGS